MLFLPVLVFVAAVVDRGYSNAILAADDDRDVCPPPELIEPITCFRAPFSKRVTAYCTNFTNAYDIKAIFDRNTNWNLQDVWIANSVMSYIPAKLLEDAQFQTLNISSSSLVTLFDTTPVTTPEINIYMYGVHILRGFRWSDIANANLLDMLTQNMRIRSFGQDFKNNMPRGVKRLWFENTGVISIKNQAFSELEKLEILAVKKGSLKKISRNMFPRPWIVTFWDLSYQKISALPEDTFVDLPNIAVFNFEGNMLTTLSEEVFTKSQVLYGFQGNPINCNCNIKWILKKLNLLLLNGECAEPDSFKGKPLRSLQETDFGYCR